MKKPKTQYKKPVSMNQAALKTARILLTVSTGVVITLCIFFIVKDGWQKFLMWFVGKWACLGAMIVIFAATLALWVWWTIETIKKVTEDEN